MIDYRPLDHSLGLVFITFFAGLVIRFVPLGLPRLVVKFGGSMLWALKIYWIASAILPSLRFLTVAIIASAFATTVEFFKFYHSPVRDAFRLTNPGILLLGRIFSAWDIAAYWIAIFIGVLLDKRIRRVDRQGHRSYPRGQVFRRLRAGSDRPLSLNFYS